MSIVVVSGASGFIGKNVCLSLAQAGHTVRAMSRTQVINSVHKNILWFKTSFYDHDQLCSVLKNSDYVIHLADNPNRHSKSPSSNGITKAIVLAMEDLGLEKIIHSSSIYARLSVVSKANQYGSHKLACEAILLKSIKLSPIILRLPPVYGAGGKGGLAFLTKLIQKNVPLPLGEAKETRDYISVLNVADLITHLVGLSEIEWSNMSGHLFEPSDGKPISGVTLCKELAAATHKKVLLFSVPYQLIALIGKIIGKEALVSSIFNGMKVESFENFKSLSGWKPKEQIPDSLKFLSTSLTD